jgi:hypothetical protein
LLLYRILRVHMGTHRLGHHWGDLPSSNPCQGDVTLNRIQLALELGYRVFQ